MCIRSSHPHIILRGLLLPALPNFASQSSQLNSSPQRALSPSPEQGSDPCLLHLPPWRGSSVTQRSKWATITKGKRCHFCCASSQRTPRCLLQFLLGSTPSLAFRPHIRIMHTHSTHDLLPLLLETAPPSIDHSRKWGKQDDKAVRDGRDDLSCTWDCSTERFVESEGLASSQAQAERFGQEMQQLQTWPEA